MSNQFPETIETPIPVEETRDLIASDKVEGTAVYGKEGEKIGTIRNVMLDKRSGVAEYAVISFGGFLGLGKRFHPVPWKALTYEPSRGGYVVGLDADQLRQAPSFTEDEDLAFTADYARGLYGYYGVPWSPWGVAY